MLNEKEIDVIQHPSSRPPLLFPCRAYNFGSQAASVVTTKVFCKNEIGTEKNPELLVTLIKRGVNFQHYCYLWPSFFLYLSFLSLIFLYFFTQDMKARRSWCVTMASFVWLSSKKYWALLFSTWVKFDLNTSKYYNKF